MVSNQDSTDGKDSEDFSNPVAVDPEKHLQFLICDTQILCEIVAILGEIKLQFWTFWKC